MIRMYAQNWLPKVALQLFGEMLQSDRHKPDRHTFPYVIKACSDLFLLQQGVVIHGLAVISGYMCNTFWGNSLLTMYMNCGDKEGARRVFDAMQVRTAVIWNTTMISGYCRNDSHKAALMIYRRMEDAGVDADCATVLSLLPACGCLKDVEMGREVHSSVEQVGIWDNLSVRNAVLDMYVKCGRMDEVRLVFEKMIHRDVMTWTTMIHGFISDGDTKNALWFSQKMQLEGVKPNAVTLASLLAACASLPHLRLGKCLHGWAIRQDLQAAVNVETGLIDMYAKCNCFRLSYQRSHRAFQVNLSEAVKPNNATPKSVLPAFSIEADLRQALSIHSYLLRSGFVTRTEVATGLLDIYSKCGNIDNGHKIFNEIPKKERDIISWSTLIAGYGMHGNGEISLSLLAGYGMHGNGEISLSLFNEMVQFGVKPNEVTFTLVLHACGHAGLVDDGL
ncbi:hypothetical protein T459_07054 [Capsicum annuum]|uniref:Pentatricopeptide repeat-containing protein n=1 Tax=Capsicum annuum TaxID=4072 RepID=A0A2G3ACJ8_CAPAN|nr:hypothetical protein T459_07054 [Capsicum annuum]